MSSTYFGPGPKRDFQDFDPEAKNLIRFTIICIILLIIVFFLQGCTSSTSGSNAEVLRSYNEAIKCLEYSNQRNAEVISAYRRVLKEVWLDRPNYVEDALSEGDAFCTLAELEDLSEVLSLENKEDSARYSYTWEHELNLFDEDVKIPEHTQAKLNKVFDE